MGDGSAGINALPLLGSPQLPTTIPRIGRPFEDLPKGKCPNKFARVLTEITGGLGLVHLATTDAAGDADCSQATDTSKGRWGQRNENQVGVVNRGVGHDHLRAG
jgi:hypothetical protein